MGATTPSCPDADLCLALGMRAEGVALKRRKSDVGEREPAAIFEVRVPAPDRPLTNPPSSPRFLRYAVARRFAELIRPGPYLWKERGRLAPSLADAWNALVSLQVFILPELSFVRLVLVFPTALRVPCSAL